MPEPGADARAGLAPLTCQLLDRLFPEDGGARWLRRDNPRLGGTPLRAVEQGREGELQRYLEDWLRPAEAPPDSFDTLFAEPGTEAR